jgi:hypothetical protein
MPWREANDVSDKKVNDYALLIFTQQEVKYVQ